MLRQALMMLAVAAFLHVPAGCGWADDGQLAGNASRATTTRFKFDGWAGPAISVRLYVPAAVRADTPIVIVMHGWSREARRYFRDWKALGKEHGFVVVVPYFPVRDFPGANEYNLGHVFDEATGDVRPRELWTFAAIEPLFDEVVTRVGGAQSGYTLYGHSAGSQFVHRFSYFMPEARVTRFLAANAGWYTLPDLSVSYPYGLMDTPLNTSDLAGVFAKDLVLLLGREDTAFDDPTLRKTPEALQQGANRFTRGHMMHRTAQSAAVRLGIPLRWRVVEVDNAAHENKVMAEAAATLVE